MTVNPRKNQGFVSPIVSPPQPSARFKPRMSPPCHNPPPPTMALLAQLCLVHHLKQQVVLIAVCPRQRRSIPPVSRGCSPPQRRGTLYCYVRHLGHGIRCLLELQLVDPVCPHHRCFVDGFPPSVLHASAALPPRSWSRFVSFHIICV